MSDKLGTSHLIIAGYIILLSSYLALYFAQSILALSASFLLLGLFPAFTDGVQRAHAAKLTTEGQRGGAFGWVNAISGFGAMVAGIGGGYLWQALGPGTALLAGMIVIILGLFLFVGSQLRS
jgi:MFS family permease